MKVLLVVLMGFLLRGKIIWENEEVLLLNDSYPLLVVKTAGTHQYKLVVNERGVYLFKKNKLIFESKKTPLQQKISYKKSRNRGGIYDILGRQIKNKFMNKGIYFKISKSKKNQKIFILE